MRAGLVVCTWLGFGVAWVCWWGRGRSSLCISSGATPCPDCIIKVDGLSRCASAHLLLTSIAPSTPPSPTHSSLYPNVDFYSGIVLRALGIPVEMYTVLFAMARTVGWVAQVSSLAALLG